MVKIDSQGINLCLVFLMLFASTCGKKQDSPKVTDIEPAVVSAQDKDTVAEPDFDTVSEATRKALILPCGRCHQSTRDTHKAGAIAVFDLDLNENWHKSLKAENLEGLSRRTASNTSITEAQLVQIKAFVAMKEAQFRLHRGS